GNTEVKKRYYENDAFKADFNSYLKASYKLTEQLSAFADAQIRYISYEFQGKDKRPKPGGGQKVVDVQQTDRLTFFNPKLGLTYNFREYHRAGASPSVGKKEPTRVEYVQYPHETQPSHDTRQDRA